MFFILEATERNLGDKSEQSSGKFVKAEFSKHTNYK